MEEAEKKLLNCSEIAAGIRLACEAKISGSCRLYLEGAGGKTKIAVNAQGELDFLSPRYSCCGLAVDIGTTTIAMKLFDKESCLGYETALNPQESYGADVISRISRSMSGDAIAIQTATVSGLNGMITKLCHKTDKTPADIDHVVITGNTAMMYLLTAEDPDTLSHLPFEASRLYGEYLTAGELGLCLDKSTPVYLTKCLAAFVGGDISSAEVDGFMQGFDFPEQQTTQVS